jgi:hypothetical protein
MKDMPKWYPRALSRMYYPVVSRWTYENTRPEYAAANAEWYRLVDVKRKIREGVNPDELDVVQIAVTAEKRKQQVGQDKVHGRPVGN